MTTKTKIKPIEKIPLSVIGLEDADLTSLETKDGTKQVLDLRRVKLSQGAEFIIIEDSRMGLCIQAQSFKQPLNEVGGLALSLFDEIKARRNGATSNSYIQ